MVTYEEIIKCGTPEAMEKAKEEWRKLIKNLKHAGHKGDESILSIELTLPTEIINELKFRQKLDMRLKENRERIIEAKKCKSKAKNISPELRKIFGDFIY